MPERHSEMSERRDVSRWHRELTENANNLSGMVAEVVGDDVTGRGDTQPEAENALRRPKPGAARPSRFAKRHR